MNMVYTYKLIKNSAGDILSISRSDGASIPVCEGNRDYQNYLTETEGMTLEEIIIPDPQPQTEPSAEERLATLEAAIATDPSIQEQIDAIVELLNAGGA